VQRIACGPPLLLSILFILLSGPRVLSQDDRPSADPPTDSADADVSSKPAKAAPGKPSVFDLPTIHARYVQGQAVVAELFRQKRYAEAEKACEALSKMVPHDPVSRYNVACAQSMQGRTEDAFASLERSIELGFRDVDQMKRDADLAALRDTDADRFGALVGKASNAEAVQDPWQHTVIPARVKHGVAMVDAPNTAYDRRVLGYRALFVLPPLEEETKKAPPIKGFGDVGKLVNGWYADGTAAGNHGDFYDNHDGDHSNMRFKTFPQLTRIEFAEPVRKRKLHTGLQTRFFYTGPGVGVVIGNSSTALTRGPMWRSQTRNAYTNGRSVAVLYAQYASNHCISILSTATMTSDTTATAGTATCSRQTRRTWSRRRDRRAPTASSWTRSSRRSRRSIRKSSRSSSPNARSCRRFR